MCPTAGLDDVEKRKLFTLPGFELRSFRRPARSQSLYRLHCPGSHSEYGFAKLLQLSLDAIYLLSRFGSGD
jgi:hypothetical protein